MLCRRPPSSGHDSSLNHNIHPNPKNAAHLLWRLGMLVLPAATFCVGVSGIDLVHAPYVAYVVMLALAQVLRPGPSSAATLDAPFHQVRLYVI